MDMPSIFEVFERRRWRQIGRAGSLDFFTGLLVLKAQRVGEKSCAPSVRVTPQTYATKIRHSDRRVHASPTDRSMEVLASSRSQKF